MTSGVFNCAAFWGKRNLLHSNLSFAKWESVYLFGRHRTQGHAPLQRQSTVSIFSREVPLFAVSFSVGLWNLLLSVRFLLAWKISPAQWQNASNWSISLWRCSSVFKQKTTTSLTYLLRYIFPYAIAQKPGQLKIVDPLISCQKLQQFRQEILW